MPKELLDQLVVAGMPMKECPPSLEELIEACGDGFHSITKFKQSPGNGKWKASYTGEFSGETTYQGKGSTPAEAVALLWISLNKN